MLRAGLVLLLALAASTGYGLNNGLGRRPQVRGLPAWLTVETAALVTRFLANGCSDCPARWATTRGTGFIAGTPVCERGYATREAGLTDRVWTPRRCSINETLIRQTADALVASGLRDAGYVYLCVTHASMPPRGRLNPPPCHAALALAATLTIAGPSPATARATSCPTPKVRPALAAPVGLSEP